MIVAVTAEVRLPRIDLAKTPEFDLGGIRVRPARRQVCVAGDDCRDLEPRVMQVLVALATARGAVVSRDQLIDACWEGRIVGDDSLNRCVVALRRLAKEIDPQPFAIETVSRVGYCLMEQQLVGKPTAPAAADRSDPVSVPLPAAAEVGPSAAARKTRLLRWTAAAAAVLVAIATGLMLRPQLASQPEHAAQVRMAGFKPLSSNLSPTMAEAFQEELTSALGVEDSVMLVSAEPGGSAPRLALGGTVRRTGDVLQFAVHLRNERSGASLWSQMFEQPASFALASRQVAVHVSLVLRCGLPAADPYFVRMSDGQLSLWLQYCQEVWGSGPWMPGRILDTSRRVTVAAPDFSRGWSSLAFYGMRFAGSAPPQEAAGLRSEALAAAREALRLDPGNGEAYAAQALAWQGRRDWRRMEAVFQRAISVRPSDCACEFAGYGGVLTQVGRLEDALAQYRRYHDRIPLGYSSSGHLADALFMAGRNEEAERVLGQALQLYPERDDLLTLRLWRAFWARQYDDGLAVLANPNYTSSPAQRAALTEAFNALRSGKQANRLRAAQVLKALASDTRSNTATVTIALAGIGEDGAAIESAGRNGSGMRGVLFTPGFVRARYHPTFAALAERLGMVRYWRETKRLPDFCKAADAPALCVKL